MDVLEKKLRQYFREKKEQEEKSIPGFDTFRSKLNQAKPVKHSYRFLKIAASVALIAGAFAYYYFHNSGAKPPQKPQAVYEININAPLPTQTLLSQENHITYIWQWKAPTDQLLEQAERSIKIYP